MGELMGQEPVTVVIQSQGTPLWLTLVTMTISLGAISIALFQAVNGYKDRIAKFPRIEMSFQFVENFYGELGKGGVPAFVLSIGNRSAVATNILRFLISGDSKRGIMWTLNGQNMLSAGSEPIPGKIDGYSSHLYWVEAEERFAAAEAVSALVHLGHGDPIVLEAEKGSEAHYSDGRSLLGLGRRKRTRWPEFGGASHKRP